MKYKDCGAALKAGRLAKGLTRTAVNTLTGISYASIYGYENWGREPTFGYMVLMCDLYDIALNDIANTVRPETHHRDRHTKSISGKLSEQDTTLGAVLRAARESKRLTTRAVESITGISYVSITRYEIRGTMPLFTAAVLMCDLYDIYIDDLANILRRNGITKRPSRHD